MIDFESDNQQVSAPSVCIKVLGVGGGGSNMVNSMINSGFNNIEFIVANTDAQALRNSKAHVNIQLGIKSTKGLGAGANPELGRRAAEEDIEKVIDCLKGADVVFLIGGLGGGTGSGALPVIAKELKNKDKDVLTIAAVTKPFIFEGKRRLKVAHDAIDIIEQNVDTFIVIPNQKLIENSDKKVSLVKAFSMVNENLNQFVRAISDIIYRPGHINVDFADVKTIMKNKGYSLIGTGRFSGEDKLINASLQAISSSMLDNINITGARSVLLNISGSTNLGLHEISEAASIIYKEVHEDANIIIGYIIDESLNEEVLVTVIASGFDKSLIDKQPGLQTNLYVEKQVIKEPMIEVLSSTITDVALTTGEEKADIDLTNLDIPAVIRRMNQQQKQ